MPQLSAPLWAYCLILYAVMSVFLFTMMGLDKAKARRGAWRISEKTLFVFALLGGAPGGTAGMFLFRDETLDFPPRLPAARRGAACAAGVAVPQKIKESAYDGTLFYHTSSSTMESLRNSSETHQSAASPTSV